MEKPVEKRSLFVELFPCNYFSLSVSSLERRRAWVYRAPNPYLNRLTELSFRLSGSEMSVSVVVVSVVDLQAEIRRRAFLFR